MIRTATAAMVLVAVSGAARAEDRPDVNKLCILSAAEKLPHIPGLTITGSRISPVPAGVRPMSTGQTVAVEIDIRAAGQDATYSYLCGYAPGVPAAVVPRGLSK